MISKNDPDYIFEEYKEYTIVSHKDNVAEKSSNNLIIVYKTDNFPENGFIVGIDDSKLSGRRRSFANNIEDAKNYIDWVTEVRHEKGKIITEPVMREIEILGTKYLLDIDQLALIVKDKPDERKLFFSEMNDCGTYYEFVYNRESKRLDPSRTQTLMNDIYTEKDRFAQVKIPQMVGIDPVGMSNRYNCSLNDIIQKSDFEIIVNQEAYDLRINKGLLSTIEIAGHTFYVDLQMDKLRPKDDFLSNGIVFSDIGTYYDSDKREYTIPYNPETHEFQEPDYLNIKELPKDLIAVRFPAERLLDRIGWNRKFGFNIKHGLLKNGLILHFTAKHVPWKETFLVDLIKSNRQSEEKPKKATEKQQPTQQKQIKRKGRRM